ncbi:hypothetical protein [Rhizobium mongolense]|uniref:hypothetical protein n=1 Tax=Rhizobium mongolense TaxID=57676 RepID=UPI00160808F9|nr:hypothetical protein [Rhizobium mongolense]
MRLSRRSQAAETRETVINVPRSLSSVFNDTSAEAYDVARDGFPARVGFLCRLFISSSVSLWMRKDASWKIRNDFCRLNRTQGDPIMQHHRCGL